MGLWQFYQQVTAKLPAEVGFSISVCLDRASRLLRIRLNEGTASGCLLLPIPGKEQEGLNGADKEDGAVKQDDR